MLMVKCITNCVKGLQKVATVPQNANLNTGFVEQVVSMGEILLKKFRTKTKRDIEIIDSLKSMDILHLRNKPTYQWRGKKEFL